jgi:hypothetical protein
MAGVDVVVFFWPKLRVDSVELCLNVLGQTLPAPLVLGLSDVFATARFVSNTHNYPNNPHLRS